MDVFTLGEVAELLQAPKTRIKNWTIGRPLRIVPRILAAQGKGSRNLYSVEDVYVFALANQLGKDGFSVKTIDGLLRLRSANVYAEIESGRTVVERYGPAKLDLGRLVRDAYFLTLMREKDKVHPHFFVGRAAWDAVAKREKGVHGKYILDLRTLANEIDERIAKLRQRS